jgi:hypothetical protein
MPYCNTKQSFWNSYFVQSSFIKIALFCSQRFFIILNYLLMFWYTSIKPFILAQFYHLSYFLAKILYIIL